MLLAAGFLLTSALEVNATFVRETDLAIAFEVTNNATVAVEFDTFNSPCNPGRLTAFILAGDGMAAVPVERVPYIEDFVGEKVLLAPGKSFSCRFDVTHWFNGSIPDAPRGPEPYKQSQLFWSFRPEPGTGYSQPIYGGVFSF
jgi:hypothetical protein